MAKWCRVLQRKWYAALAPSRTPGLVIEDKASSNMCLDAWESSLCTALGSLYFSGNINSVCDVRQYSFATLFRRHFVVWIFGSQLVFNKIFRSAHLADIVIERAGS